MRLVGLVIKNNTLASYFFSMLWVSCNPGYLPVGLSARLGSKNPKFNTLLTGKLFYLFRMLWLPI